MWIWDETGLGVEISDRMEREDLGWRIWDGMWDRGWDEDVEYGIWDRGWGCDGWDRRG